MTPCLLINKSGMAFPIYDIYKQKRVGTIYDREAVVGLGGDGYTTFAFLNSSGQFITATVEQSLENDKYWHYFDHCEQHPYGDEKMPDGNYYLIYKMRQRKNIYKRDGSYWGAVAANMFVATNNSTMGETHLDWKQITYVKRSTDGKWCRVDEEGAGYGYVDTGIASSSLYSSIAFYGSW